MDTNGIIPIQCAQKVGFWSFPGSSLKMGGGVGYPFDCPPCFSPLSLIIHGSSDFGIVIPETEDLVLGSPPPMPLVPPVFSFHIFLIIACIVSILFVTCI